MAIIISHGHFVHAAFVSSLVCQTFDRMILVRIMGAILLYNVEGTTWCETNIVIGSIQK